MANLKDLIVNGAARVIGKTYSSEFVGDLAGNATTATTASKTAYGISVKDAASNLAVNGWNGSATGTLTIAGASPVTTTATANTIAVTHDKKGPNTTAATSKGDTTNQTPGFGGTFKVPSATVDVYGHTTALADHTVTIPSSVVTTSANGLMSSADKTKLNGIASGAEVNQNAFSNVTIGSTTISADSKTDTLTLEAGSNITLTPDSANDKITISSSYVAASASTSGIVTTGPQTFAGAKTFADTTDSTNNTSGAVIVSGGLGVAGNIYAGAVYGAVWNDLSDSIPVDDDCDLEHGYCYCFDGEKYSKSSKYLDDGIIGIHSDTYGFKMGAEEGKKKMDVAVSGFVLAYVDKEYKPGTPLTCTKNGYLTKIKLRDKIRYPEKIIATYWKSEPADELGSGSRKVRVNGRKWVKVK